MASVDERRARYAEAVWGKANANAVVAAVMAVADEELAELRVEVERLQNPACAECGALPVTCAAARVKCCPDCTGARHHALAAARRLGRTESETQTLRERLTALAEEYEERSADTEDGQRYPWGVAADDLRAAALAASPADMAEL